MPKFKQKEMKPLEAVSAKTTRVREHYERTLAIEDLEQVKQIMSAQDNVKVIVPAQGNNLGCEITCSRETAKRKYSKYKHYDTTAL